MLASCTNQHLNLMFSHHHLSMFYVNVYMTVYRWMLLHTSLCAMCDVCQGCKLYRAFKLLYWGIVCSFSRNCGRLNSVHKQENHVNVFGRGAILKRRGSIASVIECHLTLHVRYENRRWCMFVESDKNEACCSFLASRILEQNKSGSVGVCKIIHVCSVCWQFVSCFLI
jgi:hypothetical protein